MAECSMHSYDPSQTVMVSNYPLDVDVGEEELTIYFKTKRMAGEMWTKLCWTEISLFHF